MKFRNSASICALTNRIPHSNHYLRTRLFSENIKSSNQPGEGTLKSVIIGEDEDDEEEWLYDPKKDPMNQFSNEEKEKIKQDLNEQGRKAYRLGSLGIGAGILISAGAVLFARNHKPTSEVVE
ncbi:hypothetical protein HK098_004934 [Nowakowskiella sp. JEL0407]|nr:hypothetical protein HK098_004934 [Nowakowskiella sp. JEL0407]